MNSIDTEMLYRVYTGLYKGASDHPMSDEERLRYDSLAQRGYLEVFIDGSMEISPQGLSAITDYEEEQERKAADDREKLNEQSRVRAERVKDAIKDVAKDVVALAAKLLNRSS